MITDKIIHYMWFGGRDKLTEINHRCIESWKRHMPDYTIMEWNEDTFDTKVLPPVMQECLNQHKYGFIVDYIRPYVLNKYGGLFLDTDLELLKRIPDDILDSAMFVGCESKYKVSVGIMGSEKGHPLLQELMNYYTFCKVDELEPCPQIFTNLLKKNSLYRTINNIVRTSDITLYPPEYFYPISWNPKLACYITDNTVAIHWWEASAMNKSFRRLPEKSFKQYESQLRDLLERSGTTFYEYKA